MDPTSSNLLTVSYAEFARASQAYDALKALGVPRERLELRALQDEAGPVEGNFVSGNGRHDPGAAGDDAAPAYDLNFSRQVQRGANLLLVQTSDEAERARVVETLCALESPGGSPVA